MKLKQEFKLQGRFKIVARKRDGSERLLADWFDNMILNAGLERIGTARAFDRAMVGSGTNAVVATQTGLTAFIASTTTFVSGSTVYNVDTVNNFVSMQTTLRFAEGVAAGNLSEVGVGWSNSACFSRAVIVDGVGAPTTITVLSDEILDVTYELRIYPDTTDVTGSMTLNGISYSYTLRPSNMTVSDAPTFFGFANQTNGMGNNNGATTATYARTGAGSLGDIFNSPGGSGAINPASVTPQTYVALSYKRVYRYIWGITNGTTPFYNIRFFTSMGFYKAAFTPEIPKTGANILTLDLEVTWARRT